MNNGVYPAPDYGERLLKRLSQDLSDRFGRGFSVNNMQSMRSFFLAYPPAKIYQTLSVKFKKANHTLDFNDLIQAFPLSWSHYVLLLFRARSPEARNFYEAEALRGGWSVRQLERQIDSQFYERTALSRNKAAMFQKGSTAYPQNMMTAEQEIKDPFVLEFLNLKDEYSESELEEAMIRHLETFLMELGSDFAFVSRQKRLRIGDQWFRIDLIFYHRRLRCLVLIDLKLDKFTHAAAGQMHLYLNYAKAHWTHPDENPPVGLILCAQKNTAVAQYALEGLPNKVMAAEYKTTLPKERLLIQELERTQQIFDKLRTRRPRKRPLVA